MDTCMSILCCNKNKKSTENQQQNQNSNFKDLSEEDKKKRIDNLWNKARRYNNKLRFQARLQKMAESNLKEMMIDENNEEAEEEIQSVESTPKLKWYLIDTNRTFCKLWNFMITILTIYSLVVTPFVLVFPEVYEHCVAGASERDGEVVCTVNNQQGRLVVDDSLQRIELIIDIIYFIEILMNFVKKTHGLKELDQIAQNYLTGYFIFDVIATIPCLFMNEPLKWYFLKSFRIIHADRLTQPLSLLLGCILNKYSKKRQNDLISFAGLIFAVIYISHIMACAWLYLGLQEPCIDDLQTDGNCT